MEKKTTSRFRQFINLPIELVQNRTLIGNLAKNDFKTRFAGSYLGVIWAFVQPIVTVVVYWFVFTVGLRQGRPSGHPFVLWLMAGLVPWFFFSEALNGGTNALIEYNYLVKKGIDPQRLTYKGYGESVPVQSNDTEEGKAANRRTEIKILEN
jgi:ABC-type polysaccharide/polyol phosphate export permease